MNFRNKNWSGVVAKNLDRIKDLSFFVLNSVVERMFGRVAREVTKIKRKKYSILLRERKERVRGLLVVFYPPGLGDSVVKMVVLRNLKEWFSQAKLTVLCHPGVADLLKLNTFIDEIITVNDEWAGRKHRGNATYRAKDEKSAYFRFKFIKRYYGKFDIVVDLDSSAISSIFAFLLGAKLQVGYGHSEIYTHFIADRRFDRNGSTKIPEHHLKLISSAGIPVEWKELSLQTDGKLEQLTQLSKKRLGLPGSYIVVNPYAANSNREWSFGNWINIIGFLTQRGRSIVVVGPSSKTKHFGEVFGELCSSNPGVWSLVGETSLVELAAVLNACELLISVDTGAVHLGAALGKPLIALCGPGLRAWEPDSTNTIVIRSNFECQSCDRFDCKLGTVDCMKNILVTKVIDAVELMCP